MASFEVVVIGGGPAGMAAAEAACKAGCRSLCILEREGGLGGVLPQCTHNGFGRRLFRRDLTGPEYAQRWIERLARLRVEVWPETTVVDLAPTGKLTAISPAGVRQVEAGSVVLAVGCRERTRGELGIPGSRPAGVFTAGSVQRLMTIPGYLPGREAVIVGSGDIGLIMARRLALEGVKVRAVVEIMPYPGGLPNNVAECLDLDIPLLLEHAVTEVLGSPSLTGVVVARVDSARKPVPATSRILPCDTLLLAAGLVPDNRLALGAGIALDPATGGPVVSQRRETSVPGIFACGNGLYVHDLVDEVSRDGQIAGQAAAHHALQGGTGAPSLTSLRAGQNIRCLVPQRLTLPKAEPVRISFRVSQPLKSARLTLRDEDGQPIFTASRRNLAPAEVSQLSLAEAAVKKIRPGASLTLEAVSPGDLDG